MAAMAKRGCLQQECFVMFNDPHSHDISSFVISDANDVYYLSRYANIIGSVWYMYLKTENYCLKIFVEIRVTEKVY